jgi:uncharacterized membrane protein
LNSPFPYICDIIWILYYSSPSHHIIILCVCCPGNVQHHIIIFYVYYTCMVLLILLCVLFYLGNYHFLWRPRTHSDDSVSGRWAILEDDYMTWNTICASAAYLKLTLYRRMISRPHEM